jgi:hypothetical protein
MDVTWNVGQSVCVYDTPTKMRKLHIIPLCTIQSFSTDDKVGVSEVR